jgi:hypothetical protein
MRTIDKEQFYTPQRVVEDCWESLRAYEWFEGVQRVIEPAAGSGAWLQPSITTREWVAMDIEPKHPSVVQGDYLRTPLPYKPHTLWVGNPPFGRRGSLAVQFWNKGSTEADYLAAVLPASFGKRTLQQRLNPSHRLVELTYLGWIPFQNPYGNPTKVRCVWGVWQRGEGARAIRPPAPLVMDYRWTRDPKEAHLALRTHGAGCGRVFTEGLEGLSKGTHRWVHSLVRVPLLVQRFQGLPYERFHRFTAGIPCVSTAEVDELYAELVRGDAGNNSHSTLATNRTPR